MAHCKLTVGTPRALSVSPSCSSYRKDVRFEKLTHRIGDDLVSVFGGVLVAQRGSWSRVPPRRISSLVLAPLTAAIVSEKCLRS